MFKYKSIFAILFLILSGSVAMAQTGSGTQDDTTSVVSGREKSGMILQNQLCIGVDLYHPLLGMINKNYQSFEFSADYYLKNEIYLVAEGGFGTAQLAYPDLSYNSDNGFAKVGINKCMLKRMFPKDWDLAFIGARYGMAIINRGPASFTTTDNIWGQTSGTKVATTFTGHWAELTGGVRVELYKGICAGWNVRFKFLLNQASFKELPPAYVAGYGKGDKPTNFDFNVYLSYAIRWNRKNI